ncbi:MAG: hypothetical protein ACK5A0_11375, partial [Polaromonas sp.]
MTEALADQFLEKFKTALGQLVPGDPMDKVTALCARLHRSQRAQLRCSAWRAVARFVVSPCWTRRARHTRAHPT